MNQIKDPAVPAETPRETVDRGRLRTDISVALQMERRRTPRDNLAREAFQAVAELIVSYFESRSYVVTAPAPKIAGPAPAMKPWQPPKPGAPQEPSTPSSAEP